MPFTVIDIDLACRLGGLHSAPLRQSSVQQLYKIARRQRMVPKRFDVGDAGFDLLFTGTQQIKHSELHRVIVKLYLVENAFLQREQNVS